MGKAELRLLVLGDTVVLLGSVGLTLRVWLQLSLYVHYTYQFLLILVALLVSGTTQLNCRNRSLSLPVPTVRSFL
jgi:hypothetical protein